MRTEQEMMNLILSIAKDDERIRAVYMNGSRTNPNVQKDIFQDYDIVFVVTETESFIADKNWISLFGNQIIVQEPDWNDIQTGFCCENIDFSRHYTWLMLFDDGNRIDLRIEIKEETVKNILNDKLTVLLLDKDNILPNILPPSDEDYHIKKPTNGNYTACCNEFWWCLNNVAKGIARDELPFAMEMYNCYVRQMLNKMVDWYIGIKNNFNISTGKMGKYYKKLLEKDLWDMYYKTYSDGNYDNFWESIFVSCNLFRILGIKVAKYFSYEYSYKEDENVIEYLNYNRKKYNKRMLVQ